MNTGHHTVPNPWGVIDITTTRDLTNLMDTFGQTLTRM
ncbi:hypothetical protein HWB05_gp118 [Streptomyces phage BRock]|uniref:Uncharacterized protein n=1 Tax=Streptomyces phage BRock TaxID=1913591 RepID=A0A1J0GW29_9CAUD|nr:hypothetical protein HWB05_gp118 [Streptomyces phage BRock]APC46380.1 hypothetical protein [Streptomyces phage BRock]